MTTDREELIRSTWQRWNAGERDPDQLGTGLTEDFELYSALTGRTFRGRQGVVDWMAEIDGTFGAWRLHVDEVRPAGPDRYLVLGGVHLQGRGSGVEFDQPIGWIVEFEGDLTRRLRNFATHEEAIAAVRTQS